MKVQGLGLVTAPSDLFEHRSAPMKDVKHACVMSDMYDGKGDWTGYLVHFSAVAELNEWDVEVKK